MNNEKLMNECRQFFEALTKALNETHTVMKSCNDDKTMYLVPNGTEKQVTYHGKPQGSFRISDHWNWKANLKNNSNEKYIQCFSKDFYWCKKRKGEGLASDPIFACSVCWYGPDKMYHVVYGEKFDRKTKKWSWLENSVEGVLESILKGE